ncbi:DUF481 domain-containing protein [Temperatibacter marinus]|uniref:DUF481 domain-containing protein n=1 Tax=Temperatibacter marinus TaxID=1456591 RepID=A0AA52EGT0_9PROT|nr:DUF481 domain-containing protein [Temperatibacter marinus]WND03388.1 DUF481 domain-containing protein [Temperatibacter marinus]
MKKAVLFLCLVGCLMSGRTFASEIKLLNIGLVDESLPSGVEAILKTSHATGDKTQFQIIVSTLQKTFEDKAVYILLKANQIAPEWVNQQDVKVAKQTRDTLVRTAQAKKEEEDSRIFDAKLWNMQAELGAGNTTGDTSETSISAGLSMKRKFGTKWEHILDFDYDLNRSKNDATGETETKKKRFRAKHDLLWRPWDKMFLVNHLEFLSDAFSGYDHQILETLGIGYQIYDKSTFKARLDIGPGLRYNKLDSGVTDTEFLGRVSGNVFWKISDSLQFNDTISYSMAQNSNRFENKFNLTSKINSSLAARLGFDVKHDSVVPAGTANWDTIGRITLVYDF